MIKNILIIVLFFLVIDSWVRIYELKEELSFASTWLVYTDERIAELRERAWETQNACEQYMQEDSLLMDYGNDQSR